MNDGVALSGSLSFLNLGDLLQLFGSNGSTGILRVYSSHSPEPGVIYLQQGNPVNAFAGSQTGTEALFALFGWIEGEFQFTSQEITEEKAITKGRMELILDGLRKLDDGEVEKLGSVTTETEVSGIVGSDEGGPLIKGPLVDYMYIVDEEEYFDGQEIVREKKHGNWIWVIVQGIVQVLKDTPDGPIEIVRITDGAFIGSMATFTVNGNIRSATNIAMGNVSLGVLDTQRLFTDFSNLNQGFRRFLLSLDRRLREVTDRVVEVRSGKVSLDAWVKGRKPAIRQGKPEERLFLITEGNATVVRYTENGYVPLARLGKGDFFGSVPFFDLGHEPHSASIFASPDLKISQLDPEAILAEYEELPPTFKKLIEHMATCISVTTKVACDMLTADGTGDSAGSSSQE